MASIWCVMALMALGTEITRRKFSEMGLTLGSRDPPAGGERNPPVYLPSLLGEGQTPGLIEELG